MVSPAQAGKAQVGKGANADKHVYRVGGLRIPVKNSVRGTRGVGRVKDLCGGGPGPGGQTFPSDGDLRASNRGRLVCLRERSISRDFSPSPHGLGPGRERTETDDDAEELDED